jgi:16S rRNA (guanine966-N2)-methyltransferase
MRISGGLARGIVLKNVSETILRPATDYLRQAIFSALGGVIVGADFLDIFAGVGGYGLEALSRGARAGIFVENNHRIVDALRSNLEAVCKSGGIKNENRIWNGDALKLHTDEQFDLIFIDPPYDLVRMRGNEILAQNAQRLRQGLSSRLIFEMPADVHLTPPDSFRPLRRIGKTGRNSPTAIIYAMV